MLKRSKDYEVVYYSKLKEHSLFRQRFKGGYDISLYTHKRVESEMRRTMQTGN